MKEFVEFLVLFCTLNIVLKPLERRFDLFFNRLAQKIVFRWILRDEIKQLRKDIGLR